MIKKFNELRRWDPETRKPYVVDNPLGTVGQLIEKLKEYDPDKKVAVNVAEDPSEIIRIVERKARECTGKGDDLVMTADFDPDDDVVLIMGNQY
jgi:hypothetical protein